MLKLASLVDQVRPSLLLQRVTVHAAVVIEGCIRTFIQISDCCIQRCTKNSVKTALSRQVATNNSC